MLSRLANDQTCTTQPLYILFYRRDTQENSTSWKQQRLIEAAHRLDSLQEGGKQENNTTLSERPVKWGHIVHFLHHLKISVTN